MALAYMGLKPSSDSGKVLRVRQTPPGFIASPQHCMSDERLGCAGHSDEEIDRDMALAYMGLKPTTDSGKVLPDSADPTWLDRESPPTLPITSSDHGSGNHDSAAGREVRLLLRFPPSHAQLHSDIDHSRLQRIHVGQLCHTSSALPKRCIRMCCGKGIALLWQRCIFAVAPREYYCSASLRSDVVEEYTCYTLVQKRVEVVQQRMNAAEGCLACSASSNYIGTAL